jgi:hypothetical protein
MSSSSSSRSRARCHSADLRLLRIPLRISGLPDVPGSSRTRACLAWASHAVRATASRRPRQRRVQINAPHHETKDFQKHRLRIVVPHHNAYRRPKLKVNSQGCDLLICWSATAVLRTGRLLSGCFVQLVRGEVLWSLDTRAGLFSLGSCMSA